MTEAVKLLFFWPPKSLLMVAASHEIKINLLLSRKAMTNLNSVWKSIKARWVGCGGKWKGGSKGRRYMYTYAYSTEDLGLTPGSGISPGVGNGNPLEYYCLENFMDRGAWWAKFMESQRIEHDWATEHTHNAKITATDALPCPSGKSRFQTHVLFI